MSKKNTPVNEKKQIKTSDQPSELKKANGPSAKPAAPAPSQPTAAKSPPPQKEAPKTLTPKEQVITLVTKDATLPKTWRESFTKRIHSAKSNDSERLRNDFRTSVVEFHQKSQEIAAVFQTERKDRREYRFLLSLAANTSGFDGKIREKLSNATIKGKRDEFMDLLTSAIFKDQPNWGKIDETIANLN